MNLQCCLHRGGISVEGVITYEDKVVTFTPTQTLSHGASYTVTVTTAVQDIYGTPLVEDYSWSFSVMEAANDMIAAGSERDTEGNLLITNDLPEALYLYSEGVVLKEIPANAANFLVMVPNGGFAQTLKIWKVAAVTNTASPSEAELFKRWELVLSRTAVPQGECPLWTIKGRTVGTASGTLSFRYPSTGQDGLAVIYSVDIFLNARTGAKITSLAPGMTNKKIGLEYGFYVVHYRYWYDNPNDLDPAYEIGWIETAGDGNPIQAPINAANDPYSLTVPIFYHCTCGGKGSVTIVNSTGQYVQIFANNEKIEDLHIATVPTDGLSILGPNGGSYTFLIPEDVYNMQAKSLSANTTIVSLGHVEAIELYDYTWVVDATTTTHTISVTNTTGETLTLHDHTTGNYLGYRIASGSTVNIVVDSTVTGLRALDRWGDWGNYVELAGPSWMISALIAVDITPP